MTPAPKHTPQEQEDMILNAAAECIEQSSLLDFTMSAVSKAACLSMGSIYKHVQSKEDIIFALATRVFNSHRVIFKRVLDMPLTTPEKIASLYLLNPKKIQMYSFDNHLESFMANELVITRASSLWTERMIKSQEECEKIFNKCMHQAAYSGEIKLNGDTEQMIDEINLGTWALLMGYQNVQRIVQIRNIADGTDSLQEALAIDSLPIRSLQRLLSAYEWETPLDTASLEKAATLLTEANLR